MAVAQPASAQTRGGGPGGAAAGTAANGARFLSTAGLLPSYGLGAWWRDTFGAPLAFSFTGLLLASILYSLPFVVQPLTSAFVNMGNKELEAAATLGFGPVERFFHIILPMTLPSFVMAAALGFAHTLGSSGWC